MSEDHITNAEVVRDLAIAAQTHVELTEGAKPFVVLPCQFKTQDLEALLPAPVRTKHAPKFCEPESFCRYVNAHKSGGTVIYASEKEGRLTGVIDHDTATQPAWREHRPELALINTPEWLAWIGKNKQPFGQVEFAEFLEERAKEIVSPSSATMQQVALTLNASRSVGVKSIQRLDNGAARVAWDEELKGTTDGGLEIPTEFEIAVSPFKGLQPFRLKCYLRWRLPHNGSAVQFHYSVQFWEKALEEAFKEVVKHVDEQTGITPLLIV